MTLSDEAYQELRDAAIAVIRAVGVDTGGSNIQFARDRDSGDIRVIEMNPRVSRSSALASKATGYPIAKVAAKLAVGYTLDEIPNDLTGHDACELRADARLRRREDPALHVREVPRRRPHARHADEGRRRDDGDRPHVHRGVREGEARARGRLRVGARGHAPVVPARARAARGRGGAPAGRAADLSPHRLASPARSRRASNYYYATWDEQDEAPPQGDAQRVVILGSGPNRIGQGVEFDYCCVHAVQTYRDARLRGRDDQLQPGDGLDRLRHVEPPLLRAARRGVGARGARARAAGGRRDPVRRPDAAQARARDRGGGLPDPRHAVRRRRPRGGPRALRQAARRPRHPLPGLGDRALRHRGRRDRAPHRLPGARSPVVRARRPRDARLPPREPGRRRVPRRATARRSSTASSSARSRSTSTRSATARAPTSARSCSTSRRPACTPATPRACCRRSR